MVSQGTPAGSAGGMRRCLCVCLVVDCPRGCLVGHLDANEHVRLSPNLPPTREPCESTYPPGGLRRTLPPGRHGVVVDGVVRRPLERMRQTCPLTEASGSGWSFPPFGPGFFASPILSPSVLLWLCRSFVVGVPPALLPRAASADWLRSCTSFISTSSLLYSWVRALDRCDCLRPGSASSSGGFLLFTSGLDSWEVDVGSSHARCAFTSDPSRGPNTVG